MLNDPMELFQELIGLERLIIVQQNLIGQQTQPQVKGKTFPGFVEGRQCVGVAAQSELRLDLQPEQPRMRSLVEKVTRELHASGVLTRGQEFASIGKPLRVGVRGCDQ